MTRFRAHPEGAPEREGAGPVVEEHLNAVRSLQRDGEIHAAVPVQVAGDDRLGGGPAAEKDVRRGAEGSAARVEENLYSVRIIAGDGYVETAVPVKIPKGPRVRLIAYRIVCCRVEADLST